MQKENHRPHNQLNQAKQQSISDDNQKGNATQKVPFKNQQHNTLHKNEAYVTYMKYLITSNSDYFANKLKTHLNGIPKNIRFKIPCKTGTTIYKRDYLKKKVERKSLDNTSKILNFTFDQVRSNNQVKQGKEQLKFDGKTMYQKDFKELQVRPQTSKRKQERVITLNDDESAPRFFDTHNKTQYLNWGGKNFVPSMKPQPKPAVSHITFSANTVYKADFEGKHVAPTPIFVREPSFPKFSNMSLVTKSNYANQFSQKQCENIKIDCKPKHSNSNISRAFKGTTEYKSEFIKSQQSRQPIQKQRTIEQIQNLIIDL